jgi:hypothetical protein
VSAKASRKRLTQKELVAREPRCIYCAAKPDSIEHMPPIWAFEARQRPKGLEFATCKSCNNGTRASDLATGFMARLRMFNGDVDDPLFKEAVSQIPTLDRLLPGFLAEVFDTSNTQDGVIDRDGQRHEVTRIEARGPILAGALTTFGAKLGMALYREHIGGPLPLTGAVFVQPYLNAGLTQVQADKMLSILPATNTLRQGRREVSGQFAYAFNSDDRSIVMALASFQQNLHFLTLSTSDPDHYAATVERMFVARVAPGELLRPRGLPDFVPPAGKPPFILPGLPRPPEN